MRNDPQDTTSHRFPLKQLSKGMTMKAAREGEITAVERKRILDRIEEIRVAENHSHAAIAGMLGVATSIWSQVRSGKYRGDSNRVLVLARQWLGARNIADAAPPVAYAETSIGKLIMAVCERALSMPCIAQVMMPSGAGKTTALMEYARRMGDRCVYLPAGEAYSGKEALLVALARRLGFKPYKRERAVDVYDYIRSRLAGYYAGGRGVPFMLIIDEATTLRPAALNILRNLHDDAACRMALVLADTWRMDVELHRAKNAMAGGYEQLRSRLSAVYRLSPTDAISVADVRAVVDSVAGSLGHSGRLHADSYKFLTGIAQSPGKLRNVHARLQAVHAIAVAFGAEPAYSVRELDYVAELVGAAVKMDHAAPPFGEALGGKPEIRNPKPETEAA